MPIQERILSGGRLEFVNRVPFRFSGSGGESMENAIVMSGGNGNPHLAFWALFDFVDALFPRNRFRRDPLQTVGGRRYEALTITTYDGREVRLFLDVTAVLVSPEFVYVETPIRDERVIEDHTDLREKTPDYVYLCFCGWPPAGPNPVHLIGSKFFYNPQNGEGERCCAVSSEQWRHIALASDTAGIWSLPGDMGDSGIIGGLSFSLKIKVGSRMHRSEGQLYEHPIVRESLLVFHRALQELARESQQSDR